MTSLGKLKIVDPMPSRILIVEDDLRHRKLQRAIFDDPKYAITEVENGKQAITAIQTHDFDVVLLDKQMPEQTGDETLYLIRKELGETLLPVIMVTGSNSIEDLSLSMRFGATDFVRKPYVPAELLARVDAAISRKRLTDQLDNAESVLFALARMVEAKDENTGNHCERLEHMAGVFGERLGLSSPELNALRMGGVLHDIGKIGIPDKVLLKEGPLDESEWDVMRTHSEIGARLCSDLKSVKMTLPIIRSHHERWDGSGYPGGLKGEDIPLLARVFQQVDIFDALSTRRPYKEAFEPKVVIQIMEKEAEKGWLDPELTEKFLSIARTEPEILTLPAQLTDDKGAKIYHNVTKLQLTPDDG